VLATVIEVETDLDWIFFNFEGEGTVVRHN